MQCVYLAGDTETPPSGILFAKSRRRPHYNFIVCTVVKIYHHSFWEFRACIFEIAKLAHMVRDVVQEMHLYTVEI